MSEPTAALELLATQCPPPPRRGGNSERRWKYNRELLHAAYGEYTSEEIAEKVGVSAQTVRKALSESGAAMKPGGTRIGKYRVPFAERAFKYIEQPANSNACWFWTGTMSKGYGQTTIARRHVLAHRAVWELVRGRPFPEGMHALHSCDNGRCVNPDHIRPGTHAENMKEAGERGLLSGWSRASATKKTHCSRGHELTQARTQLICKTCHSERNKKWKAKKHALSAGI